MSFLGLFLVSFLWKVFSLVSLLDYLAGIGYILTVFDLWQKQSQFCKPDVAFSFQKEFSFEDKEELANSTKDIDANLLAVLPKGM